MNQSTPTAGDGIGARVTDLKALSGAARSAAPPVPRSAKIELTSRCHLRCTFCSSARRQRARGDMAPALFARIASTLRQYGVEHLGLFYIGEPFLHERLAEAVRYAKEGCGFPYIFLTTNAVCAAPHAVRACMETGLDSLKFAFNWAGPDQFREVTGAPSRYFATALENVRRAREIRDAVERATGHRCALSASSLAYDEAQGDRMTDVLATIEQAVDEHYWLPLVSEHGIPPREERGRRGTVKRGPCWALFKEAHVTWDGQLSACPLDASRRFHMGDLATLSFMEAWHGPEFQALRTAHLEQAFEGTVCEKCLAHD